MTHKNLDFWLLENQNIDHTGPTFPHGRNEQQQKSRYQCVYTG